MAGAFTYNGATQLVSQCFFGSEDFPAPFGYEVGYYLSVGGTYYSGPAITNGDWLITDTGSSFDISLNTAYVIPGPGSVQPIARFVLRKFTDVTSNGDMFEVDTTENTTAVPASGVTLAAGEFTISIPYDDFPGSGVTFGSGFADGITTVMNDPNSNDLITSVVWRAELYDNANSLQQSIQIPDISSVLSLSFNTGVDFYVTGRNFSPYTLESTSNGSHNDIHVVKFRPQAAANPYFCARLPSPVTGIVPGTKFSFPSALDLTLGFELQA